MDRREKQQKHYERIVRECTTEGVSGRFVGARQAIAILDEAGTLAQTALDFRATVSSTAHREAAALAEMIRDVMEMQDRMSNFTTLIGHFRVDSVVLGEDEGHGENTALFRALDGLSDILRKVQMDLRNHWTRAVAAEAGI